MDASMYMGIRQLHIMNPILLSVIRYVVHMYGTTSIAPPFLVTPCIALHVYYFIGASHRILKYVDRHSVRLEQNLEVTTSDGAECRNPAAGAINMGMDKTGLVSPMFI